MIEIRALSPEDAGKFRELRLQALSNNPEAFGGTYDEFINTPIETVRARIGTTTENFILGAFTEMEELIGMVGFWREQSLKMKHKGNIWGMYVSSNFRSQGLGKRLIQELINRTKMIDGLEQINLCVVTSNQSARNLYISIGFEIYGLEKCALKHNGQEFDEEFMTYRIKQIQ